jgi:hypothetical protein
VQELLHDFFLHTFTAELYWQKGAGWYTIERWVLGMNRRPQLVQSDGITFLAL